jgi:hypothetical protein
LCNVSHRRPLRLFASVLTTGLMMFGMTVAVTPSASAAACTTWNPGANGEGGRLHQHIHPPQEQRLIRM